MPLYSIIVPMYNEEENINNTMNSLRSHLANDCEIIIIDDGSTDDSVSILKKISSETSKIKLIEQTNSGVSSARNTGLKHATGDYVIFVDADDETDGVHLEDVIKEYGENDLICMNNYRNGMDSKQIKKVQQVKKNKNGIIIIDQLIRSEYINSIWNKIYKRSLLLEHKIEFSERISMGEDLLFNYKYLKQSDEFILVPFSSYNYKTSEGSLTQRFNLEKYKDLDKVYDYIKEDIKKSTREFEIDSTLSYLIEKRLFSEIKHRIDNDKLDKLEYLSLRKRIFDQSSASFLKHRLILRVTPYIVIKKLSQFYVKKIRSTSS